MKLIILDRDGVINYDSEAYIKSPEEWLPIPQSLDAIAMLKQAGFTVAVASNQSGIARQLYDEAMLARIHQKMQTALADYGVAVDKIVYCPHKPDFGCDCRKPRPGMLLDIAQHFQCELKSVPFIGDRMTDVAAARAAGAIPILVKTGYDGPTEADAKQANVAIYDNLYQATKILLNHD